MLIKGFLENITIIIYYCYSHPEINYFVTIFN